MSVLVCPDCNQKFGGLRGAKARGVSEISGAITERPQRGQIVRQVTKALISRLGSIEPQLLAVGAQTEPAGSRFGSRIQCCRAPAFSVTLSLNACES